VRRAATGDSQPQWSRMMFVVQATFFSELFGPTVRYTGLSIAYQVSAIIGGTYAADCRRAAARSDTA
jgi:hypothetical protein